MVENCKVCPYYSTCNLGQKVGQKENCEKKYNLDSLFSKSCLSDVQRKHISLFVDADSTDINEFKWLAELEKNIEQFVASGQNLYIHSSTCGNGKSSWSIRLLSSYFYKIWHKTNFECQGLFVSVPRYLLALKDSISNYNEYTEFIQANILKADLVVWDDLGNKAGSEFELNHLLNAINTRMDLGKSNIFTSNLSSKEMTQALGERLASRVCNKSIEIEFHGSDKRKFGLQTGGN